MWSTGRECFRGRRGGVGHPIIGGLRHTPGNETTQSQRVHRRVPHKPPRRHPKAASVDVDVDDVAASIS
ncbi:hypothetical protein GUJ93_ZPchr0011g27350 [Zizania palustris]|uniref:Uncharacterized protein n=1 Tax=Zizania palustris TaxID=103762 RepID=A0A8J5WKJ3_ZIZPA|nr:hypothetical protein GUJ93_ZPchr0011g27350 [Zizania palustris]